VILVAVASFLAYEDYSLLIGESATPQRERIIRARLAADPAVRDVILLHTMHRGRRRCSCPRAPASGPS